MTEADVNDLFKRVELAVRDACRLGFSMEDARLLTRVEISTDGQDAIRAWARDLYQRHEIDWRSFTVRGVSYYVVAGSPWAWRVIGISAATTGRLGATDHKGN